MHLDLPDNLTGRERAIVDCAVKWTAVRGRNPRNRARITVPTLADARRWAASWGDGRTMIYAVTADGQSAHVTNA